MPRLCRWFATSISRSRAPFDLHAEIHALMNRRKYDAESGLVVNKSNAYRTRSSNFSVDPQQQASMLIEWLVMILSCTGHRSKKYRSAVACVWQNRGSSLWTAESLYKGVHRLIADHPLYDDLLSRDVGAIVQSVIRRAGLFFIACNSAADEFLSRTVAHWDRLKEWAGRTSIADEFIDLGDIEKHPALGRAHVNVLRCWYAQQKGQTSFDAQIPPRVCAVVDGVVQKALWHGMSVDDIIRVGSSDDEVKQSYLDKVWRPINDVCHADLSDFSGKVIRSERAKYDAACRLSREAPEYAALNQIMCFVTRARYRAAQNRLIPFGLARPVINNVRVVSYFSRTVGLSYTLEQKRLEFVYCCVCMNIKSIHRAWGPYHMVGKKGQHPNRRTAYSCAGLGAVRYNGSTGTFNCMRLIKKQIQCPAHSLRSASMIGHSMSYNGRLFAICANPLCSIVTEVIPGVSTLHPEYGYYCAVCTHRDLSAARSSAEAERKKGRKRKRMD